MMASGAPAPASPSSSPRLPSPPPFPEVQIGPKSPSPGASPDPTTTDSNQEQREDNGATRRIRPGTKAADMASGPPLIPLAELDSPFQLQEHLMALFLHSTRSPSSPDTSLPITRASATKLATPPDGVDRALWLYELCRLLVQRANSLIVGFFADTPPCSASACPEMRASEWQYLCAVHDPPKSCCAIDYCCHTLDWAANVLTSQKHFPSRLSLGGDAPGGSAASVRQLTNIFRRVYRMFAHAWFQHRDVFWQLEGQEGLYVFYKTVCDVYALIPEENYTVPLEAEGGAPGEEGAGGGGGKEGEKLEKEAPLPPKIERQSSLVTENKSAPQAEGVPAEKTTLSTGATTRRHKHTPSTGSMVTTIQEGDEDGDAPREGVVPTFVSTVRRDPSSSPPKQPPPMPRIPDVEVTQEEPVKEEDKGEEVAEKLGEMSIEDEGVKEGDKEVDTEEDKDGDKEGSKEGKAKELDPEATPRIGSEPEREEKVETKEEAKVGDGKEGKEVEGEEA